MVRRSGSWKCVLSFVVALICLSRAASAFAQGATGTITGTVVDGTGAALPGATVNVTEAATGSVRTAVTDGAGLFRFAALNPGRYSLAVELASFRTLNVADINLLSTEVRDLGKLALQVGGITETVTITSEITPVQVADSSRRSTLTQDDIASIPTKGRDIFGMLGTLPGVQDTNLNRDFTQWRSAISITINGMPSQNKDVRVDGINIVDEGGCGTAYVNLNMDAVGEVQVISNGYTAENGRNNGGVISMVTKSGTNQLRASAYYNGRRDKFNENDYFREASRAAQAALPSEHLRLQRRRAGGDPGRGRQPEGQRKEVLLLRLAGIRRRRAADVHDAREHADGTRVQRRLLADLLRRHSEHSGNHPAGHSRPDHRPALPGQQDSGRRQQPAVRHRVQLHRSARPANAPDPPGGQLRDGPAPVPVVDVEFGLRSDAGARPHQ